MTKKIQKIRIEHNDLGDIEIYNSLPKDKSKLIGTIADDYSKFCFYYGDIYINNNETITIKNLKVIKTESVNIGWKEENGLGKNYINVFKNLRVNSEIVCYNKSIISVFYENTFKIN